MKLDRSLFLVTVIGIFCTMYGVSTGFGTGDAINRQAMFFAFVVEAGSILLALIAPINQLRSCYGIVFFLKLQF